MFCLALDKFDCVSETEKRIELMLKTLFVGLLTLLASWPQPTSSFMLPVQVFDLPDCQ